jgi:hypothetical protein
MATSINGWPVLSPTSSQLVNRRVPGTNRYLRLRADVAPLLLALAAEYHRKIRSIDTGTYDDWGYAYRQANAADAWSDHSSGTAMDLNATGEGAMGSNNYNWWLYNERYKIAKALKAKYGVVIWGGATALGGDYRYARNWDWMHWAIRPGVTLSQVKAQIAKLGIRPDGTVALPPTVTTPVVDLSRLQTAAKVDPTKPKGHKSYAAGTTLVEKALVKEKFLLPGSVDGSYTSATVNAYSKWQKKLGYTGKDANGIPGKVSLTALGKKHGFKVVN